MNCFKSWFGDSMGVVMREQTIRQSFMISNLMCLNIFIRLSQKKTARRNASDPNIQTDSSKSVMKIRWNKPFFTHWMYPSLNSLQLIDGFRYKFRILCLQTIAPSFNRKMNRYFNFFARIEKDDLHKFKLKHFFYSIYDDKLIFVTPIYIKCVGRSVCGWYYYSEIILTWQKHA